MTSFLKHVQLLITSLPLCHIIITRTDRSIVQANSVDIRGMSMHLTLIVSCIYVVYLSQCIQQLIITTH